MDIIHEIWPQWHTDDIIGRGASGDVYRIRREYWGEVFYSAVKVIRIPKEDGEIQELLSDGHTSQSIQDYYGSVARGLINEIKLLEELKSADNVVHIEEFEIREREKGIGWEAYIRMELLENLDQYRAKHPLDQRETAKLGVDICRALICCAKNKIVHRDIKPTNIFVDSYGHFKLGDFGVARQMEKTYGTLSHKGTEAYMAPELYLGRSRGGHQVDIYSLGLVMYRLLNKNKLPFEPLEKEICSSGDREEALYKRLKGLEMPLPVQADPSLGHIILKACQCDLQKRYLSAEKMMADLEAWLAGNSSKADDSPEEIKVTDRTENEEGWEKTVGVFQEVPVKSEEVPEANLEEEEKKTVVLRKLPESDEKTDDSAEIREEIREEREIPQQEEIHKKREIRKQKPDPKSKEKPPITKQENSSRAAGLERILVIVYVLWALEVFVWTCVYWKGGANAEWPIGPLEISIVPVLIASVLAMKKSWKFCWPVFLIHGLICLSQAVMAILLFQGEASDTKIEVFWVLVGYRTYTYGILPALALLCFWGYQKRKGFGVYDDPERQKQMHNLRICSWFLTGITILYVLFNRVWEANPRLRVLGLSRYMWDFIDYTAGPLILLVSGVVCWTIVRSCPDRKVSWRQIWGFSLLLIVVGVGLYIGARWIPKYSSVTSEETGFSKASFYLKMLPLLCGPLAELDRRKYLKMSSETPKEGKT